MALLEEYVSLWGWALRSLLLKLPSVWQSVDFLLPARYRTLSYQNHVCLHTAMLTIMTVMD